LAKFIKLLETVSKGRTAVTRSWIAAVWRQFTRSAFADIFQKLYERCQPWVVKDGDYFEGQ
jgi:hypothetical protein